MNAWKFNGYAGGLLIAAIANYFKIHATDVYKTVKGFNLLNGTIETKDDKTYIITLKEKVEFRRVLLTKHDLREPSKNKSIDDITFIDIKPSSLSAEEFQHTHIVVYVDDKITKVLKTSFI